MLPVFEMLDGVAALSFATPPVIDKAKSVFSRSPLPPPVLYAFSLRVIVAEELSLANVVWVIEGPLLSFRFALPLT